MKGPYERLKYDLRRLWECPQCGRRERTEGAVTFRLCSCQASGEVGRTVAMKLVEESGHRTKPPINSQLPPAATSAETALPAPVAPENAAEPPGNASA